MQTSVSSQEEDELGPTSPAGQMEDRQKTSGVSFNENKMDRLMVGRCEQGLKQEQYDVDVVMLGKTSYLREHEDCTIAEYCSALTLSELEGTSRYSLNTENYLSVSEERKDESVSSSLDDKADKTTFSASESNLHDCLLGRRDRESWNKVPVVKSGDTKSVCLGNHPVGVEKYQIKEEMVSSSIKDNQIVDEITEDTCVTSTTGELADVPLSSVPCGSAKQSSGWSKVKKVFLLQRFVKELERLKKFNPRMPRYLPIENDPREEIVHLRHQELGDKKNAEEWMLDYARKQVVGKLEPARKRKVQLLVDAFETVLPLVEQDSVQMEASETVIPSVDQESDESIINETSRRLCTNRILEWTLAATNIILEALSAAFEQVASPNKPNYALIGLLMSVIAVSLCIGEFIYKARKARVVFRRWGFIWWLSSPFPEYEPFGSFSDIFGLICATFQCIFSIIQYAYFRHHAENPLKISVLPLIFALCVAYSRFHSRDREPLPHIHYP